MDLDNAAFSKSLSSFPMYSCCCVGDVGVSYLMEALWMRVCVQDTTEYMTKLDSYSKSHHSASISDKCIHHQFTVFMSDRFLSQMPRSKSVLTFAGAALCGSPQGQRSRWSCLEDYRNMSATSHCPLTCASKRR